MKFFKTACALMKTKNFILITLSLTLYMSLMAVFMYGVFCQHFAHIWRTHNRQRETTYDFREKFPFPTVSASEVNIFVPAHFKKKDWHNYQQMEEEKHREGLGKGGQPAKARNSSETPHYADIGFDTSLSDSIPLNRSLPDIRQPECRKRFYLETLPTVSVIIAFNNEHYNTLLRTVSSVLYRSPEFLIKEIILVDDFSSTSALKEKLDKYVKQHFPKVTVHRLTMRRGLVTARLVGAGLAKADVLVFLDSHVEPNVNWLPPLLEPIALNYTTVVLPIIDHIDRDTFEYIYSDPGMRGSFNWKFYYRRAPLPPRDEANLPEPFETPVMMGGLFAISRRFFWELGGYDPGLSVWGGEQYELSFKVWQCGGRMLEAPCSRVGHIFRQVSHPVATHGYGDYLAKNYRRVAEVWMDEYADYLYQRKPYYWSIEPGDLTQQKALRKKLQCKSFKWYMTEIAYDIPTITMHPNILYASGRIRPVKNPELCVDVTARELYDVLELQPCLLAYHKVLHNDEEQTFEFTWFNDIKARSHLGCWDTLTELTKPGMHVHIYHCTRDGGNQQWRYFEETKRIQHQSGLCLDYDLKTKDLHLNHCSTVSDTQKWDIDKVYSENLAKWNATNTI